MQGEESFFYKKLLFFFEKYGIPTKKKIYLEIYHRLDDIFMTDSTNKKYITSLRKDIHDLFQSNHESSKLQQLSMDTTLQMYQSILELLQKIKFEVKNSKSMLPLLYTEFENIYYSKYNPFHKIPFSKTKQNIKLYLENQLLENEKFINDMISFLYEKSPSLKIQQQKIQQQQQKIQQQQQKIQQQQQKIQQKIQQIQTKFIPS